MKKALSIVVLLITLRVANSQSNQHSVFLTSVDKRQKVYVELTGESGTVLRIGTWPDKAGIGYSIVYSDTVVRQSSQDDALFAGKKTTIQQEGNRLYLVVPALRSQKQRLIEIDTISNTGIANTDINHGYWWDSFLRMTKRFNEAFPLQHYSFRNGFSLWDSFTSKEVYHQDFRTFADHLLRQLKDSLTTVHTTYTALTDRVAQSVTTIEYAELKTIVSELNGQYVSTVINAVCLNRPELFFRLAEDMPDRKQALFFSVDGKEVIKKLKAVETTSPAKKEFLKAKRQDRTFTVKSIVAALAGAALLGFSIYVLAR